MKKWLFVAALICITFASCKKDDELGFSDSELNFDNSAATKDIKITASVNWTLTTEADWITLTPLEGSGNATLNVSVNENVDDFERYTDVIISQVGGGGLSATLKVRQQPASLAQQLILRRQDSLALVALYNATNGDGWKNKTGWKTGRLDEWHGVLLWNNRVDRIFLHDNLLTGNIPSEIGNLSNLKYLWLQGNQLSGSIPAAIGDLKQVEQLFLNDNMLSGNIPAETGNLSQLAELVISRNQLSGNIPAEIGKLSHLVELLLNNNELSGSIPAEMGNLTRLQSLLLNYNQLTGEVPETVINMMSANPLLNICPQNGAGFSNYSCE